MPWECEPNCAAYYAIEVSKLITILNVETDAVCLLEVTFLKVKLRAY